MKDLTFTLDDYLQTTGDPQEEIRQAEIYSEGLYPPASTEWQNSPIARGTRFKELIVRKSRKERAIAPSLVDQLELIDRNDRRTLEDGIKRYQKQWAVPYVSECGSDWQYITESKKDKRGYVYLAPAKAGNRAFFPAIPTDIREVMEARHGKKVPLDGGFWQWAKTQKDLPIDITEGGGKSLSALSHGYLAIAVYGCSCLGSPDLIDYFKGRDIRISLDSDSKPSAVRAVTRSLAKHLRAISKIAKSVKVVTWDSKTKGLDDLIAMGGAEAYEQAIANAVSAEEWLANHNLSIAKQRLEDSKIKADIELDALPTPEELKDLQSKHRDPFLVAQKGLGKSILGGAFVRDAEYALIPSPLESLARNNANRMTEGDQIVHYRTDCDRSNGNLNWEGTNVKLLSFCTEAIQSLRSHIEFCLASGEAVVFNDELDLQSNSLATSPTHSENGKRKLNQSLYWDMQMRAKNTLSVGADLTNYEVELWERKTGRKPFVIKVKPIKKGYSAELFSDKVLVYQKLIQAIRNGERVIVHCTRKSDAKFLQWALKAYGAIALHADNKNDPMFEGFFDDPNEWLANNPIKILITSPVLRTGFSITKNFFDKVFCFFEADSLSASTCLQFSERYRLEVPRVIYAASSNGHYNGCSIKDLLRSAIAKSKASGNNQVAYIDEHDSYFHYLAENNWSKAHFRADILARLEDEVENVIVNSDQCDEEDSIAFNLLRKDFKEWQDNQSYEAENWSKEIYEAKKDRRDLIEAELLAKAKYELANWSDRTPDTVTIEQIRRDNKGRKRKALERFERQSFPELAIKADNRSLEVQVPWGMGVSYQDLTHHALVQRSLEVLGVHEFLDYALSGKVWSKDTEIVQKLGTALRNNRNYVQVTYKNGKKLSTNIDTLADAGINLTCAKNAYDNSYVGALLSWLGLKTTSENKRVNGDRVRFYHLCPEDLQITREELNRRAERLVREGLQLTASHSFVDKLYEVEHTFSNSSITGVCTSNITDKIIPEIAAVTQPTSSVIEVPLQQPQHIPEQNTKHYPPEQVAPPSVRSPLLKVGLRVVYRGYNYVIKVLGTASALIETVLPDKNTGKKYETWSFDLNELIPI